VNKPTVWINVGVVVIYGESIDAEPHQHQAIQLIWPKSESWCRIGDSEITKPLIINSKVTHQLQIEEGYIMLIEPKSVLGQILSDYLNEQPFVTYTVPFVEQSKPYSSADDLTKLLAPLFGQFKLNPQSLDNNHTTVKDKRIQKLLQTLNECLHGECIKPMQWRAAQVASQYALSESRFLHLFSEQLGIAWRPYLLWRRMMCAIQVLLNNNSATEAAHQAGFSDSAHLSRTFRNTFGMSIRQALALFK